MPDYSKQIVYLSDAQYQELVSQGTITVNGTTITYNANNIYVTPQTDPIGLIAEKYENLVFPVEKGTHCIYNGGYYEANQTISTSESWTAAHWVTLTNVGAEAKSLKNEINGLIIVDDTQPSASENLLWIDEDGGESYQIPSYAEHTALANRVTALENGTVSDIGFSVVDGKVSITYEEAST